MHRLAKTRERGALITDLLVERGQRSLVLDGYRGLPTCAAPFSFSIRCNSLLGLSLGDAASGKQAHECGAGPQSPAGKRAQCRFDPHRIPVAKRPAMLLEQADVLDAHGFFGSFSHVINGQRRDGNSGQGFHLHAGFTDSLCCGCDHHAWQGVIQGQVHIHFGKRQRMT